MRPLSENVGASIKIHPCQICNQLKKKFYLCNQNHSTCDDCKDTRVPKPRQPRIADVKPSPGKKQVHFSIPDSERPSRRPSPSKTTNRLSPSTARFASADAEDDFETSVPPKSSPRLSPNRPRSPSNDPPSLFSARSPIKSLVTIPKAGTSHSGRVSPEPEGFNFSRKHFDRDSRKSAGRRSPPLIVEEHCSDTLEIFCVACGEFVEVHPVTLPINKQKYLVSQTMTHEADEAGEADEPVEDDENFDGDDVPATRLSTMRPMTSVELYDEKGLLNRVENLHYGLIEAVSHIIDTQGELDEVKFTQEKIAMDVDMLRGGLNYVFFNFDSVLKRGDVRLEERICGIPFVLMVRMRNVNRVPHLGFFIGLEPYEGRAHSPLKKVLVLRAHNNYGKVIEKHALETFENGHVAHPCFDVTKKQDGSLFGYANFLKRDRILKPDMLKEGRLCLSLQIKPLT